MKTIKDKKAFIKFKKICNQFLQALLLWVIPIFISVWGVHFLFFKNADTYMYYQKAINQSISPELWNIIGTFAIFIFGVGMLFKIEKLIKISGEFFYYVSTMGFIMIGVLMAQVTIVFSLNKMDPRIEFLYGITFISAFFIFIFLTGVLWYGYYAIKTEQNWITQSLNLKIGHRIGISLGLIVLSMAIFYKPSWTKQSDKYIEKTSFNKSFKYSQR